MKFRILVHVLLFLGIQSEANSSDKMSQTLQNKYPQKIFTSDYGILTEKDIFKEWEEFEKEPFGKKLREGIWQCVPTADVRFHYETWKDSDPMGSEKVIITLCDFEFQVRGQKIWSDYLGRRGLPLDSCLSMQATWVELTHQEEFVCLNGLFGGERQADSPGRKRTITHWTWNKFQTKKGCFSYFENECSR
ncbi:hypothetical protein EBR03_04455 [bacterium]|jgi:hypothetical protein|nr:hypothetical protein [bacterium]